VTVQEGIDEARKSYNEKQEQKHQEEYKKWQREAKLRREAEVLLTSPPPGLTTWEEDYNKEHRHDRCFVSPHCSPSKSPMRLKSHNRFHPLPFRLSHAEEEEEDDDDDDADESQGKKNERHDNNKDAEDGGGGASRQGGLPPPSGPENESDNDEDLYGEPSNHGATENNESQHGSFSSMFGSNQASVRHSDHESTPPRWCKYGLQSSNGSNNQKGKWASGGQWQGKDSDQSTEPRNTPLFESPNGSIYNDLGETLASHALSLSQSRSPIKSSPPGKRGGGSRGQRPGDVVSESLGRATSEKTKQSAKESAMADETRAAAGAAECETRAKAPLHPPQGIKMSRFQDFKISLMNPSLHPPQGIKPTGKGTGQRNLLNERERTSGSGVSKKKPQTKKGRIKDQDQDFDDLDESTSGAETRAPTLDYSRGRSYYVSLCIEVAREIMFRKEPVGTALEAASSAAKRAINEGAELPFAEEIGGLAGGAAILVASEPRREASVFFRKGVDSALRAGESREEAAETAGIVAGLASLSTGASMDEARLLAAEISKEQGASPTAQGSAAGGVVARGGGSREEAGAAAAVAVRASGGNDEEAQAVAGKVAAATEISQGGSPADAGSFAALAAMSAGAPRGYASEIAGRAAMEAEFSLGGTEIDAIASGRRAASAAGGDRAAQDRGARYVRELIRDKKNRNRKRVCDMLKRKREKPAPVTAKASVIPAEIGDVVSLARHIAVLQQELEKDTTNGVSLKEKQNRLIGDLTDLLHAGPSRTPGKEEPEVAMISRIVSNVASTPLPSFRSSLPQDKEKMEQIDAAMRSIASSLPRFSAPAPSPGSVTRGGGSPSKRGSRSPNNLSFDARTRMNFQRPDEDMYETVSAEWRYKYGGEEASSSHGEVFSETLKSAQDTIEAARRAKEAARKPSAIASLGALSARLQKDKNEELSPLSRYRKMRVSDEGFQTENTGDWSAARTPFTSSLSFQRARESPFKAVGGATGTPLSEVPLIGGSNTRSIRSRTSPGMSRTSPLMPSERTNESPAHAAQAVIDDFDKRQGQRRMAQMQHSVPRSPIPHVSTLMNQVETNRPMHGSDPLAFGGLPFHGINNQTTTHSSSDRIPEVPNDASTCIPSRDTSGQSDNDFVKYLDWFQAGAVGSPPTGTPVAGRGSKGPVPLTTGAANTMSFDALDSNSDGVIDRSEFAAAMQRQKSEEAMTQVDTSVLTVESDRDFLKFLDQFQNETTALIGTYSGN